MENKDEKYTEGYSQKKGEWKLVGEKKMAKKKGVKILEEVAAMKVGNKEDTNSQSEEDDVNAEDRMDESGKDNKEDTRYDTASEMKTETDTVSTQHVNSVNVRRKNTEVNSNEARMAEGSKINCKGVIERTVRTAKEKWRSGYMR